MLSLMIQKYYYRQGIEKMEIEITQGLLDEINMFINTRAVQVLNDDAELSFPAMAFVLQSLLDAVDKAQERLDND